VHRHVAEHAALLVPLLPVLADRVEERAHLPSSIHSRGNSSRPALMPLSTPISGTISKSQPSAFAVSSRVLPVPRSVARMSCGAKCFPHT
jgi:hypothetical protein